MINNTKIIFAFLISLLIASCRTSKFTEKIIVKDTIIVPQKVSLDTTFLFKDSLVYLKDTTGQMTITIERTRDKYYKVNAICKPKEIKVPITKTITKTKQVIVKNSFYKYSFFVLLLIVGLYVLVKRFN